MSGEIKQGARWRYKGSGKGFGVIHTIVLVEPAPGPPNWAQVVVSTWSEPYDKGGGDSWNGPACSFLHCFAPLQPQQS